MFLIIPLSQSPPSSARSRTPRRGRMFQPRSSTGTLEGISNRLERTRKLHGYPCSVRAIWLCKQWRTHILQVTANASRVEAVKAQVETDQALAVKIGRAHV